MIWAIAAIPPLPMGFAATAYRAASMYSEMAQGPMERNWLYAMGRAAG